MTGAPCLCQLGCRHAPRPRRSSSRPATVASLGLQVRLVPVDVAGEHQLTDLLAAWDALRSEQESLFGEILALLRAEGGQGRPEHDPSRSPDC